MHKNIQTLELNKCSDRGRESRNSAGKFQIRLTELPYIEIISFTIKMMQKMFKIHNKIIT